MVRSLAASRLSFVYQLQLAALPSKFQGRQRLASTSWAGSRYCADCVTTERASGSFC